MTTESSARQQTFNFNGGNNTLNLDQRTIVGPLAEPITEPLTVKVTSTQKQKFVDDANAAGYSTLSLYLRDMLTLGMAVRPFLNHSIADFIRKKF